MREELKYAFQVTIRPLGYIRPRTPQDMDGTLTLIFAELETT